MPPMATPPVKRKWSDLLEDDTCEKQLLMELCAAKLRYVNPPRPPKRRTEVPLLRSVLIVNAMKHLSSEMKSERTVDYSTEDLAVDPGHFEGLPPLSELLTDIMLDPQPCPSPVEPQNSLPQQQQSLLQSFNWPSTASSSFSPLTPLQPTIPSYMDSETAMDSGEEEKIVHNLLPCTSVLGGNSDQTMSSWDTQNVPGVLDSFLSSSAFSQSTNEHNDIMDSDLTFQTSTSRNPLPSFTSLFDSSHSSTSYTDLSQASELVFSSISNNSSSLPPASTSSMLFPSMNLSLDETGGSSNLTESDLEFLAMTFSAKLPTLSIEELVHALPQSSLSQQICQTSQSNFFVPSSLQTTNSNTDANPATNNQCASFCRKDQPPPSVDDSNMVRVLVNL